MITLSEQKGKGFRKSVGFTMKKGKRKQRKWWLGKDRQKAEALALRIQSEWRTIKQAGGDVWTDEGEQRINELKASLYGAKLKSTATAGGPSENAAENAPPIPEPITFHQAIEYYCLKIIPELHVSEQWKRDLANRMRYLKDALTDLALVEIGPEELTKLVNYYKSRPRNKQNKRVISVDYAKTLIKTAKRLFEWLDETERWNICRTFNRIFKISATDFKLTNKERVNVDAGKPIFTIKELTQLYSTANSDIRGYMTLSLNCGFTQSEINSLLVGECHLDDKKPYIARTRQKVGNTTLGKWRLWDETVSMIRQRISPVYQFEYMKEGGVVYYRWIGHDKWVKHSCQWPGAYEDLMKQKRDFAKRKVEKTDYVYHSLVHLNEDGIKTDAIASAWWRLLKKCPKVSQYSFKSLRKTGADLIKEVSGLEEVVMAYLCHSPRSVAGRHYIDPDYERLGEALLDVREKLKPVFDVST